MAGVNLIIYCNFIIIIIYSLAANAPTSLTPSIIDSTSTMYLLWTAPVGGANGYIVKYNDAVTDVSSTGTVLSGLSTGTVYSITVYGYKDIPSVASDSVSILLDGKFMYTIINDDAHTLYLVPVQVSDVSVHTVTSTSMTVTWTPPNANTYSAITYYNISYVTGCSEYTIFNSTTVTDPAATSVTVTDLEEGITYTITVTAVNGLGESDPMQIVQAIDPIRKDLSIVFLYHHAI